MASLYVYLVDRRSLDLLTSIARFICSFQLHPRHALSSIVTKHILRTYIRLSSSFFNSSKQAQSEVRSCARTTHCPDPQDTSDLYLPLSLTLEKNVESIIIGSKYPDTAKPTDSRPRSLRDRSLAAKEKKKKKIRRD